MSKVRLLFVCIGNACRSQMAEGLARHLGGDAVDVQSAGLMPMTSVPSQTRKAMLEREIPIDDQYPKGVEVFRDSEFDLVLNMSGLDLPRGLKERERRWSVGDPFGRGDGVFRQVRDDIEKRVAELLEEIRQNGGEPPPVAPPRKGFFSFGRS